MITGPDDLLPDQLTERLRASGALPVGRVTAIYPEACRTMLVSTIMPLRVEYSSDAPGDAPTRLLLKSSRDGLDAGLQSIVGEREVAFYTRAAPLMPGGLLPRCYDAEYSSGRFHLLLEDLSETHMAFTQWPLPPSVEACERIVDTWAIFHAFWWRHPRLGREVGTFLDDAALARRGADYRGRYERFAETLGDRLGSRGLRCFAPTWPRTCASGSPRGPSTIPTRSPTAMPTSGIFSTRVTAPPASTLLTGMPGASGAVPSTWPT